MRSRVVTRYYCDFCKKAGLSSFHMRNHEARCTANTARVCRMHKHCKQPQVPVSEMIMAATVGGIDALRKSAGGCPACILAALRQGELSRHERGPAQIVFDFKAEMAAFWAARNEEAVPGDDY